MSFIAAFFLMQALPESAFARHGPPSNYDALRAIQHEFTGGVTYDLNIMNNPRYPVDVQLFSCEFNADRRLTGLDDGIIPTYSGYDCILDVYPMGDRKLQVYGFFYHTGLDWRYYGTLVETLVVRSDRYGNDLIQSRQSAKPGGAVYEGQPFGTSVIENPYKGILDLYEDPAVRRGDVDPDGF